MINPITGYPFNNFKKNTSNNTLYTPNPQKDEILKQQIKKYVDEVVNVITSDLIANFNPHPNATKRYVYTIGNFGAYTLLRHPQLPSQVVKNLSSVYKNDIERIYPINELMEGLKEKFPKYRITLNFEKTTITIDWSI
jgi:hypothetical protein